VPAAAVIPAPMAYTNIAAVETLVVDRRARGCGAVRGVGGSSARRGTQPPTGIPRARGKHGTDQLLPEASFSGGRRGVARYAGPGSVAMLTPTPGAVHGCYRE